MEILDKFDSILISYPFLAVLIIYTFFGLFVWFEVWRRTKNK